MQRRTFLRLGTGAAMGGALAACGGSGGGSPGPDPAPRAHAVTAWNNVALTAIRTARTGPTIASRTLAIVHTAMYDAWAAYDGVAIATRLGATLRRPAAEHTPGNKTIAISYAAYHTLLDQFPSQKAAFDAQMAALGLNPASAGTLGSTPDSVGLLNARAVIAYRNADGANALGELTASGVPFADYTGYQPQNPPMVLALPTPADGIAAPGHWQPLTFRNAAGVLVTPGFAAAQWFKVKPFALAASDQFRPAAPAAFGSQEYVDQAQFVIDSQASMDEARKAKVEYWAGGLNGEVPPGYWSLFGQFVSQRDGHDDDADVRMFFALANASLDAGIAAWDAKRYYDSQRPVTAIRYLMRGKLVKGYGVEGPATGLQTIAGEAWVPFQSPSLPTPPFPDHVSGHSSYSAASAEVLRLFTNSDAFNHSVVIKAGTSLYDARLPPVDTTLAWATFSGCALEAGMSRIDGGIHFPNADSGGRALGKSVGAAVFARAQAYWLGQA
jgi:hypothetical protein